MGSGVWSGCACYSAGCTPEATWLSTMAALGGSPSTIVDGGRSSITIENGGCIGKKVPEASYAPNTRKRHSSPSHVLQPSRVQSHPLSLGGGGDLHALLLAVGRRAVDLLARLADLLEDGLVGQVGDDLCGLVLEGDFVRVDAVQLLEHAVDGTGAAAAGHADVEFVGVRHGEGCGNGQSEGGGASFS